MTSEANDGEWRAHVSRNRTLRVLLAMLLGLGVTVSTPSTSGAEHGDAEGFEFRPEVEIGGKNGWYLTPGVMYFRAHELTMEGSNGGVTIGDLEISSRYWYFRKAMGDCWVDDQQVDGRFLTVDGNDAEWAIPLPPKLLPEHFDPILGFTYEGSHEVTCTIRYRYYESSTIIDFIPSSSQLQRYERSFTTVVKFDSTPPTVTTIPRRQAETDADGVRWHNEATLLDVVGSDGGSGVTSCSSPDVASGLLRVTVPVVGPSSAEDKRIEASCKNEAGLSTDVTYVYRFDDEAPQSVAVIPPTRNGWHRGDSVIDWGWTDRHSGVQPLRCPAVSTPQTEGEAVLVSGTCTDWAGNRATASQTLSVDASPPVIGLANRPQPNAAGWYNEDVLIEWACADDLSGPESPTTSRLVSTEGQGRSVSGMCTDLAGNVAHDAQDGINLDKTPPTATPTVIGEQGLNGWYVSPVSVNWNWSDSLSGTRQDQCRSASSTQQEGWGQILWAGCSDVADNTHSVARMVDVDLEDPEITAAIDAESGANGWFTSPVTISYACEDSADGSGLESGACPTPVTVDRPGVTTITRSVRDRAGRMGGVSTTVKVDLDDPAIELVPEREPDVGRWYTSPVSVEFQCQDPVPGSGIADCPSPVTVSEEGDRTISGTAVDRAGRRSVLVASALAVDLEPPDATIDRRGDNPALDRGRVTGTAMDRVAGIHEVVIRWRHPSRGPEGVLAEVVCSDTSRRVCTWTADVPMARDWDLEVVAVDRVGRRDPTAATLRVR